MYDIVHKNLLRQYNALLDRESLEEFEEWSTKKLKKLNDNLDEKKVDKLIDARVWSTSKRIPDMKGYYGRAFVGYRIEYPDIEVVGTYLIHEGYTRELIEQGVERWLMKQTMYGKKKALQESEWI